MDAALECVVVMDGAGLVVEWNPAAEATFGYGRDEAVGAELAELIVPPPMRDAHRAGLERIRETGVSRIVGRRVEMTARRSAASRVSTARSTHAARSSGSTSATVIRGPDGAPRHLQGVTTT